MNRHLKPRALATLVNDRDCRVLVEFYGGKVYFHCRLHRWSVRAMRTLDAAWPKIKRLMATLGFSALHLFIPANSCSTRYRFCERFGFREEWRNNHWIMMRQEVSHA